MQTVRLSTLNDYSDWLKLAKEVEPLFGPMTDDPLFCDNLRQAILGAKAFCLVESENTQSRGLFLGGVLVSPEANEIAWLAVVQHRRGEKIGAALLSEALKHLDHTRPMTVTTFDRTTAAGMPARRLYESFGFRDSLAAGLNPAGMPTVTMTLEKLTADG